MSEPPGAEAPQPPREAVPGHAGPAPESSLPPPEPLSPAKVTPSSLQAALRAGRLGEVLTVLQQASPVRRAELFVQLRPAARREILRAAAPELSASILADSDSASVVGLLEEIGPAALAPALGLIPPDNLADILLRLPERLREEVLSLLDGPLRGEVRALLSFDPGTAGGLMTTRYLSVPEVVSVGRALELLRAARGADGASYIYIVDAGGRLVGVAPLRKLITANPRRPIREIMVGEVVRLRASTPREDIVRMFSQYHFLSLPVVDDKDRLVGIVTSDDIMAAMRQAGEDVIRGLTGVDPGEALKETFAAARGRIPWITVTLVGGLGCALVGLLFRRTLAELVVLGLFIPVVLALGESVGAQTVSVVLTTLGDEAPGGPGLRRFLLKEILVGLLVAAYAAVVMSLVSALWLKEPGLGIVIGAAVLLSVSWAALLAVAVPRLMRRFRVNPAIASGPLVLVLTDLSTLFAYFGGAALFQALWRH